jgi:hypothetical protein
MGLIGAALADDEALQLIRSRSVPVALNLTEAIKSRDPEGDYFRRIVDQRAEPAHSKQGFYVCSPDGTLLEGWMYPRPEPGEAARVPPLYTWDLADYARTTGLRVTGLRE